MGMIDKFADLIANRIVAKRQTTPAQNERGHYFTWGNSTSGVAQIPESEALKSSTALACGTIVARTFAMLPKKVRVARGPEPEDGTQELTDHPVAQLLNGQF